MYLLPSLLRSVALAAPLALAVPDIPLNAGQLGWSSLFGRPASGFALDQFLMTAHQHFNPNAFDFWTEARKLGDNLARYADQELEKATVTYTSVAEKIGEFKATMEQVVTSTRALADRMQNEGIDLEELSEKLAAELNTVLEDLKVEFSEPLPGDGTPRQIEREKMINSTMSKVEDAAVRVTALWGVSEANSRAHFKELEPHVKSVLFITGQVIDQHPVLVGTLLFTGAALIIPEAWLLRPLLGLFGFGPYGPVKGSTAAWAQSRFWGGAVSRGSWFSRLQSAGMKPGPGLCKTIGGSLCVGVGIGAALLGC